MNAIPGSANAGDRRQDCRQLTDDECDARMSSTDASISGVVMPHTARKKDLLPRLSRTRCCALAKVSVQTGPLLLGELGTGTF